MLFPDDVLKDDEVEPCNHATAVQNGLRAAVKLSQPIAQLLHPMVTWLYHICVDYVFAHSTFTVNLVFVI